MHHAIVDGWSAKVLATELRAIYRARTVGGTPALAELSIHSGHLAMQERAQRNERAAEYWRTSLGERRSQDVGLPIVAPPGIEPGLVIDAEPLVPISAPDATRLAELARAHRAPFGVALVAAIASALAHAARESITIALTLANRVRRDQHPIVGCLVDLAPLHIDLRGNPDFTELLVRVWDAWKAAHAHRLPYGQIHRMLRGQQLWCEGGLIDLFVNFIPDTLGPGAAEPDSPPDEPVILQHRLPHPQPYVYVDRRPVLPTHCCLNLSGSSQRGIDGELLWSRDTQGVEPVRALSTRLGRVVSQA